MTIKKHIKRPTYWCERADYGKDGKYVGSLQHYHYIERKKPDVDEVDTLHIIYDHIKRFTNNESHSINLAKKYCNDPNFIEQLNKSTSSLDASVIVDNESGDYYTHKYRFYKAII